MKTAYSIKGFLLDRETIKLEEPLQQETGDVRVIVEFESGTWKKYTRRKMYGILKGEIILSQDFNEPLDCLREYMP